MTNPTSTAVGQTEQPNQEEFEDEREEGGLCQYMNIPPRSENKCLLMWASASGNHQGECFLGIYSGYFSKLEYLELLCISSPPRVGRVLIDTFHFCSMDIFGGERLAVRWFFQCGTRIGTRRYFAKKKKAAQHISPNNFSQT